jgi:SAM-dependent methyltransferase
MLHNIHQAPGSFRDPSGHVYMSDKAIFRTIRQSYAPHWSLMEESGFAKKALERGLLLPFTEIEPFELSWKTLQSQRLPFISYPYEWSFSQLKDAAGNTLKLMGLALEHGLILKDASAFNVQFIGSRAIFIDHLSFEIWRKDLPWPAYLQFCRHFLAPLALMATRSPECGVMSANWVDGLPLELVSSLLPFSTKFSPFLAIHIHAHAKMQKKHNDARKSAAKLNTLKVSAKTVPRLYESLAACVDNLRLPAHKTEWGDYYEDTNYSKVGADSKAMLVRSAARAHAGKLALDLGANTGTFSRILSEFFDLVVAADMDYLAVEKMYLAMNSEGNNKILPLVLNLSNPTPSIGWAGKERQSFFERLEADFVNALALIHHLVLTAGIPLDKTAEFFSSLLNPGGVLLLEFVPFEDSQVQRMLAARKTLFTDYSLSACVSVFRPYFELLGQDAVVDSKRTMLVLRKKRR